MILTIPRRVEFLTGEAKIPEEMPLFKFSPIKEGLTFYNNAGKLVAQVLKRDGAAFVTLGDGGCLTVRKVGSDVTIDTPNVVKADEYERFDEEKRRTEAGKFIFFGNAKEAQYEIFHKIPGVVKPVSLAQAVAHPINERVVNVRVNDRENLLLAVSLCMAVSLL